MHKKELMEVAEDIMDEVIEGINLDYVNLYLQEEGLDHLLEDATLIHESIQFGQFKAGK